MRPSLVILLLLLLFAAPAAAQAIVCAENFYGDVARQIASPGATILSILNNPDQDPHSFEASPSVARAISMAQIVVINGAGYDPWAERLVGASGAKVRTVIVVADLMNRKVGDNPHIWYDPATMAAFARALSAALSGNDPSGRAGFESRRDLFLASLAPIEAKIAAMRARDAGIEVTATEPVFGLMAAALGLRMRNERFQLAVMNDTEPAASDIAAIEGDLRGHRVRLLIFNSQATDNPARRLLRITRQAGVPVVGVTETEPAGSNYQDWMKSELDAVEAALLKP